MAAHASIRRDDDGTWWWVCVQTAAECGLEDLLGTRYPTHADAIAGAIDHLKRSAQTRAATTERTT